MSGAAPQLRAVAGPTVALRVSIQDSIGEVPRAEWDALAEDNVLASHGWLSTLERTRLGGWFPRYVTVRDGSRLVGAAVFTPARATDEVETLDHVLFGRLRRVAAALGLSFLPALVCGLTRGAGAHPLLCPALRPGARSRVLDLIVEAVECAAARLQLRPCFGEVRANDVELASGLAARGYVAAVDTPLNVLDIETASFDDYLRQLDRITRGARKDVRRQLNQNRARGTTIVTLDDPESAADRLHELMNLNERAHNARQFGFSRDFFTVVKRNLGDDAIVYAAMKGDRITAVSLLLRRGQTAHLPMVGVDHAAAGRDFTFFTVAHHRPFADAIASGIRRLYLGRSLYELKARRGCRLEETLVFYRPSSRLAALVIRRWFAVLSAWNRAKLPRRARRRREAASSSLLSG